MNEPALRITRRRLPHWTLSGSTYFITFRVQTGTMPPTERRLVLDHVKSGHGKFYEVAAALVMPDHVHLILRPLGQYDVPRIMKGIKGVSARRVNELRGTTGRVWQEESWDRILRDAEEYEEKLEYMHDNPVKVGLVRDGSEYEFWYFNPDFA
jgi:REP element-mobilizing transposase RayT